MTVHLEHIYDLEVYPDRAPLEGGVFKLPNDDYLQAVSHLQAKHYSLMWPTDMGAVDAISVALNTFGHDAFTNGSVAEIGSGNEDNAYGEGAAGDVLEYVQKEIDSRMLRFVKLTSPNTNFFWSAPAKRIVGSNLHKAELGLTVRGVTQAKVNDFISRTALSGMSEQYPKAMRLLSVVVPTLRQA